TSKASIARSSAKPKEIATWIRSTLPRVTGQTRGADSAPSLSDDLFGAQRFDRRSADAGPLPHCSPYASERRAGLFRHLAQARHELFGAAGTGARSLRDQPVAVADRPACRKAVGTADEGRRVRFLHRLRASS